MKKDHIEEIYKELEGFSKEPPPELWNNIEARLHPKKKQRVIFWFWGSAAAILVVFIGYMFINSNDKVNKPIQEITDIEHSENVDTINESDSKATKLVNEPFNDGIEKDSVYVLPNGKEELLKSKLSQKQLSDRSRISKANNKESSNVSKSIQEKSKYSRLENSKQNNSYAQNKANEKDNKVIKKDILDLKEKNINIVNNKKDKRIAVNDSLFNAKEDAQLNLTEELMAISETTNDTVIKNTVIGSRWSVEVLGGLSNTASESSIQGASINTTPQNDFVYAFKVGYAVSDRLVVKSGIGKNALGQEINNIFYTGSDASLFAEEFQSIVTNEDIVLFASPEFATDVATSGVTINEGTLQQQFDYIQVPLEISYNVLSKQKFNLGLGIGGNVNFLTDNRTFLDDEQIGESLGVEATIFGAMLNSNISYSLTKHMNLFIEPSYNYFEKPINNNNQNFSNTQLRVLFGVRYKL